MRRYTLLPAILLLMTLGLAAQAYPPPPNFGPGQLDQLVQRVALYPDPLLAQVLAAATYSDQIPDAANWADRHHYLTPDQMANALYQDQVPWDPSVQALAPFPSVLDMMARDPGWTRELGDAFLAQPNDVMDAVQRERRLSYDYGYLRSNRQVLVRYGQYIEIVPAGPGYYYVPVYDPAIVYYRPRPGFFVGGAINFGFGIHLGAAFQPWGWGYSRFGWGEHRVFINNAPWGRTYANRTVYVHPFNDPRVYRGPGVNVNVNVNNRVVERPVNRAPEPGRPAAVAPAPGRQEMPSRQASPEQHQLHERSVPERQAAATGKAAPREEHKGGERKGERRPERPERP